MRSTRRRIPVHYHGHTRDRDGEVVLLFKRCADGAVRISSPVVAIRKANSAVLDLHGKGNLIMYIVTTGNTEVEYEIQTTRAQAEHLARALRGPWPGRG